MFVGGAPLFFREKDGAFVPILDLRIEGPANARVLATEGLITDPVTGETIDLAGEDKDGEVIVRRDAQSISVRARSRIIFVARILHPRAVSFPSVMPHEERQAIREVISVGGDFQCHDLQVQPSQIGVHIKAVNSEAGVNLENAVVAGSLFRTGGGQMILGWPDGK